MGKLQHWFVYADHANYGVWSVQAGARRFAKEKGAKVRIVNVDEVYALLHRIAELEKRVEVLKNSH